MPFPANATDALIQNKIKLSSYIRKFRVEQLQSHIWGRASQYMRKCANISSYMRRPFVIYATAPFLISFYMREIWFSFWSVWRGGHTVLDRSPFEATKWPGQKRKVWRKPQMIQNTSGNLDKSCWVDGELEVQEELCDVDPGILLLENVSRQFHGNFSCVGQSQNF